MTEVWIAAHGLDRGRQPCGCSGGGPGDRDRRHGDHGGTGDGTGRDHDLNDDPDGGGSGGSRAGYPSWGTGGHARGADAARAASRVCIHRRGWRLVLHPDGTTTAYGPTGRCCTATHRRP